VFVAFDGEEQGLFGSLHYVEYHDSDHNIPGFTSNILGMVNLDMIAYNQPTQDRDVVSILDGDGIGKIKSDLVSAINSYSGGVTARDEGSTSLSDHFYFDFYGIDAALVIESAMGSVTNNPHYHEAADSVDTPDYIDYAYGAKITRGIAGYVAQAAKPLGNVDILTASISDSQLTVDYDPTRSGGAVVTVRATDSEGLFVEESFSVVVAAVDNAMVQARHIFYDNSYWDSNIAGSNSTGAWGGDDAAVAPDKEALLGDGVTQATSLNYTTYAGGINGLMIDVQGLADPAGIDASDFIFRYGNNSEPDSWNSFANNPSDIDVRLGDGVGGSDRIVITWDRLDGPATAHLAVPTRNWLEVTVMANADTGLTAADVFYFGNCVGDANYDGTTLHGDWSTVYPLIHPFNEAPLTSAGDIDRNGRVLHGDRIPIVENVHPFESLAMIIPPASSMSSASSTSTPPELDPPPEDTQLPGESKMKTGLGERESPARGTQVDTAFELVHVWPGQFPSRDHGILRVESAFHPLESSRAHLPQLDNRARLERVDRTARGWVGDEVTARFQRPIASQRSTAPLFVDHALTDTEFWNDLLDSVPTAVAGSERVLPDLADASHR
jgi:hypothetical protein